MIRRLTSLMIVLLAPALIVACSSGSSDKAQMDNAVTMEQFMAMSVQERLMVCQSLVASNELGACVEHKPSQELAGQVSEDGIKEIYFACASEIGSSSVNDIAACANKKLNAANQQGSPYSEEQLIKAQSLCAAYYSASADLGSCVSQMLHHVDMGSM